MAMDVTGSASSSSSDGPYQSKVQATIRLWCWPFDFNLWHYRDIHDVCRLWPSLLSLLMFFHPKSQIYFLQFKKYYWRQSLKLSIISVTAYLMQNDARSKQGVYCLHDLIRVIFYEKKIIISNFFNA